MSDSSAAASAIELTRARVADDEAAGPVDEPIIVQPFRHQVGGHTAVVTVPGSPFVAKPVDPKKREYAFYLRTPKALGGFIPAFYGVQSAQFSADATPDSTEAGPASDTGSEDVNVTKHDAKDNGATPTESNAWSLSMYKKALDLNSANSGMTDFILLENLTARFKLPCVMDIKIGKRSYADDASPNKRVRSEEKSRSTTSHVLGFRLCGMQVYSQPNGRYLRADKYYGRELTPATVPDALSRFFSLNLDRPLRSCSHSRNLVHAIVDRLDALKDVLSTLSGLRFYSSSVLMVYEGDPSVRAPPESLVDLRIIDFANTTFGGRGDEATNGPDESFLFGLNTLATMLRDLTSESDDSDSHGGSD